MRVGVIGATGYAGSEVLRLCASHPDLEVVLATGETNAGKRVGEHVPALAAAYPTTVYAETDTVVTSDVDVVFVALPHGQSQKVVPELVARNISVVDLGADFRLSDVNDYRALVRRRPRSARTAPEGGLRTGGTTPQRVGRRDVDRRAGLLSRRPARSRSGRSSTLSVIERRGIIVNALSGTSGAGRALSERLHFSRLAGNAEAYGLLSHRHTPEIQQELDAELLFTPHLVATSRGMLVTAYARVRDPTLTTESALALLRSDLRRGSLRGRHRRTSDAEGSRREQPLLRERARRRTNRVAHRHEFDRQPHQGRGGPGDSGLERRHRARRDARTPDDRRDAVNCVVVKLGGHALDSLLPTSPVLVDLAHDVARTARRRRERRRRARRRTADRRTAGRGLGSRARSRTGFASPTPRPCEFVVMALSDVNVRIVAALNDAGLASVGTVRCGRERCCVRSRWANPTTASATRRS